MKFSIVIPCYPRHFHFLDQIIEQINNFTITSNFCINDIIIAASETESITIHTTSKYPIVVHTTINKCNAATNRNRGWEKVSGDWIVFLDADDVYHPDKLAIIYDVVSKFPDIDCVNHSFIQGKVITKEFLKPIRDYTVVENQSIHDFMFPDNIWHDRNPNRGGYNIGFPKKHFSIAHGISTVRKSSEIRYNEKLNYGEDGHFCSKQALANKLIVIDAKLMIYNRTQQPLTTFE
jgi:glycosyltransferase involved in cell wall biosynthesis